MVVVRHTNSLGIACHNEIGGNDTFGERQVFPRRINIAPSNGNLISCTRASAQRLPKQYIKHINTCIVHYLCSTLHCNVGKYGQQINTLAALPRRQESQDASTLEVESISPSIQQFNVIRTRLQFRQIDILQELPWMRHSTR